MIVKNKLGFLFVGLSLMGQDPAAQTLQNPQGTGLPAQQGQALLAAQQNQGAAEQPSRQMPTQKADALDPSAALRNRDQEANNSAIDAAQAEDRNVRRFAADLFTTRQTAPNSTEGGIADDYVLGVGDQLQVNAFGSANFEAPLQVDGRGELVVPKVGSVKVAGLNLARARTAVQAKVGQLFSRTSVDISILKLREVRVFVLGEVYRPGTYLVPSLSSLVNVLSLSGGPTAAGSFRQIRVLRGGKVVHQIDLYPLRAEGVGNMNFALQSGDTLFVPLAFNQITLEGAFTRVVANNSDAQFPAKPGADLGRKAGRATDLNDKDRQAEEVPPAKVIKARGDQRLNEKVERKDRADQPEDETVGLPPWLLRWQTEGKPPSMQFELLPEETVQDALRFGGGLALQAFEGNLMVRRLNRGGVSDVTEVPMDRAGSFKLQKGDVLSALSNRERLEKVVTVTGWARVPGAFSRTEGLRVGDLLKREAQVLPDTYLHRGEIIRTLPDLTSSYLAFDVEKALAGQNDHNILLQDRDRVELYRTSDFRLLDTVRVLGPVTRPGLFPFHQGMRASDLLFQAGIPRREADHFVAELAHTKDGKPSEVKQLDLSKLLSSEAASPVQLADDNSNPLLRPMDQLSVYTKPGYLTHQTVTLRGQVNRPGTYVLDSMKVSLRDILVRAGGLTEDAMPESTIFLRPLAPQSLESITNSDAGTITKVPTLSSIDNILTRLNETKRQPTSGEILKAPLLHPLGTGNLSRLIVNIPAILAGDPRMDVDLVDGDEIIIPRRTVAAFVVGETASPFMTYKVNGSITVRELVRIAGGLTRNADESNIRLLKADGRILDHRVMWQDVRPGDAVLVPQKIARDTTWQENLQALTPLALILNALHF